MRLLKLLLPNQLLCSFTAELVIYFTWAWCSCFVQVWHWRQIFHGVGREYDSSKQYKVEDLIGLHLTVYHRLIDSILSSAIDAYGVEQRFNKIRSFWMDREFKLAKHVLDSDLKSGQSKVTLLFLPYFVSLNRSSYYHCYYSIFVHWCVSFSVLSNTGESCKRFS